MNIHTKETYKSEYESFDGYALPFRGWLPGNKDNIKAILLGVHGFNDYSGAFAVMAPYCRKEDIAIYAYDQRGFGETIDHGYWVGSDRLAGDLISFSNFIRSQHRDIPIVIMGESMGAAVIIMAELWSSIPSNPLSKIGRVRANRFVFSAPAVWSQEKRFWLHDLTLNWMTNLLPHAHISANSLVKGITNNSAQLEKIRQDPLVIQNFRIDSLSGVVTLMNQASKEAHKVNKSTFLLHGKEDGVIPLTATQNFWSKMQYDLGHVFITYPEGMHMLTRDTGRREVIADIISWTRYHKINLLGSDKRIVQYAQDLKNKGAFHQSFDVRY